MKIMWYDMQSIFQRETYGLKLGWSDTFLTAFILYCAKGHF